jgi:HK97 family phage prohead protease
MADKYNAADIRRLKAEGHTMPDGSYPIDDVEDLGNAIKAVGMGNADHDTIRKYIIGRAKAMDASHMIPDTWSPDGSLSADDSDAGRSMSMPSPYTRTFGLEDISVRSGGDGRTVEAYASVFNTAAPVRDQDGEYEEIIDPSAFNRAIDHQQRSGRQFPVLFNHGMTIFHTPDPEGGIPIGVAEEVRADRKGLFTRSKYHNTPRADQVLEAIREGSISAYSFGGSFLRSTPSVPARGFKKQAGTLPTVRRMEASLREFGPATFPVYANAEIVGVRAEQVASMLGQLSPLEFDRLRGFLGTPGSGPAADDPPAGHSTQHNRQIIRDKHARLARQYPRS